MNGSTVVSDDIIQLHTERMRLSIDPNSGAIISLIDLPTGYEFITAPSLYEIEFGEKRITERDASKVTVKKNGNRVTVIVERHGDVPIGAECQLWIGEQRKFVHGNIKVRANNSEPILAISFPVLTMRMRLGQSGRDDYLVLPRNDGCLVENPSVNLHGRWPGTLLYPGSASMQFMAFHDATAGVFLACNDSDGYKKQLHAHEVEQKLIMSVAHIPPANARTWEVPYEVSFTTFHGDWQTSAALYKTWAVKQPWCRATLRERITSGDVPKWLSEPSLFYAFSLRGEAGEKPVANRVPMVAEHADTWKSMLDAPLTFMLMAWEHHGPWVTPHYFPPFGGEETFKAATEALHKGGHRTLVFLSGLNWILRKTQSVDKVPYDDTAGFERGGRSHAIVGRDGKVQIFGEPGQSIGEYAIICAATPLAREILLNTTLKCIELGIDCVQVDQIVGGGQPVCFASGHGHQPGGGNWCAQALYCIFDELRRVGKQYNPDFALSMEEPCEFFISMLDTYHAREYAQGRWPRDGPGVIGVPLFTHVYHEFMHGYGGDSCGVSSDLSQSILYEQAMNIICGKTPGVAVWRRWFDPSRHLHPVQLRLLRNHIALWRTHARDYLLFGERVATKPLYVPTTEIRFWTGHGYTRDIQMPVVLHSGWNLTDDGIGYVLACIGLERVKFSFSSNGLKPGTAVQVTLLTEQHHRWEAKLPVQLEMSAGDVVLVEAKL